MGAYDNLEPGNSPSLPPIPMLHRADTRRRITLFLLFSSILIFSFVALKRQGAIDDIIETSRDHWSADQGSAAHSSSRWGLSAEKAAGKAGDGTKQAGELVEEGAEQAKGAKVSKGQKNAEAGEDEVSGDAEEGKEFGKGLKVVSTTKGKGLKAQKGKDKEKSIEELDQRLSSGGEAADATEEKEATPKKPKVKPAPASITFNERKLHDQNLIDLRNTTLGFGQIYVLNMKERTDKMDAIRLTSSLSGFNVQTLVAPDGKSIPMKALPGNFSDGYEGDRSGAIGCWRGHMDFANEIIQNNFATALIMEDDADWDVNLRTQLEYVALGAQALCEQPADKPSESPYGDNWDLLWLGHCGSQPQDGDSRRVVIKNDKTVTPQEHRVNFGTAPKTWPTYENTTRIMFWTKGATCTYSYALSYRGAQKILNYLSLEPYNAPIDFGLHDMCHDSKRDFNCIGIFPQLICDHKPAGDGTKDSDINRDVNPGDSVRKKGFTYNIVHSARMNVKALLKGKLSEAKSQWPDDTPKVEGGPKMEWHEEEVNDTPD